MKEKQILLGVTKNNEVVFADVMIKDNIFTASFDIVKPIAVDDEVLEERAYMRAECMTNEEKYELLKLYDARPSELEEILISEHHHSCSDFLIDTSLFPKCYNYKGVNWMFESDSCGQVDIGQFDFKYAVSKALLVLIYDAWKEYHLKEIPIGFKYIIEKEIEENRLTSEEIKDILISECISSL